MKTINIIITIIILTLALNVKAGTADLEVSMDFDLPGYVEFGYVGEFSITLTNHGPDVAGASSGSTFPIMVYSSPIPQDAAGIVEVWVNQNYDIQQDCIFLISILDPRPAPDAYPEYIFEFRYPQLQPDQSITCYGKYVVGLRDNSISEVTWQPYSSRDTDPDESNNAVSMVFRGTPAVVPAFSEFGLILLCFILMCLTYVMKFAKSHKYNLNRS